MLRPITTALILITLASPLAAEETDETQRFTAHVIIMGQGEELFTLARTQEEEETSSSALEMLRRAIPTEGNFKIIFSNCR